MADRDRAGRCRPVLHLPAPVQYTYLRLSNTLPEDSDQANLGLQAWDMLHGSLLLHGWSLSDTSFCTTELPLYMLLELILGLNTGIFHAVAAMTYTLACCWPHCSLRRRRPAGRPVPLHNSPQVL